jgi:cytochrome c
MGRNSFLTMIAVLILTATRQGGAADAPKAGDPNAGAQVFRPCAACHTLEPGVHRTGPSLAGVFGRKAGTAEGFHRYSDALRSADLVWSEDTLTRFLADPQAFLPGNRMTLPGISDAQARADVIAHLKETTELAAGGGAAGGEMAGGMMAAPELADLKSIGPEGQVVAIRYCGDTYEITTVNGQMIPFWEFNLRFKTDSSAKGPPRGRPALVPASMMGDRAFVIFAAPEEISRFIESKC